MAVASYPHDAAEYLHEYLESHISDPVFQLQEVEHHAVQEGIDDWPEQLEGIWAILQSKYYEVLRLLERQIAEIEGIRSVTQPQVATAYPHPVFESRAFRNTLSEPDSMSNSPWISHALGLPPGLHHIDKNLSNIHSFQLRSGGSYINFQIAHVVLRKDAARWVPDAWDGVRSILYIQDINIRSKDRQEGLTEQHCLALLADIARQNQCTLMADVISDRSASVYKTEGFTFPLDDETHALKKLVENRGGEKWYRGVKKEHRGGGRVTVNNRPLDPAFDLEVVSPTGLSWGYGGAGPLQLAIAITCDLYGKDHIRDTVTGSFTPEFKAIKQLVEGLSQEEDFTLTASEIRRSVNQFEELQTRNV